jgi:hypothetical protein
MAQGEGVLTEIVAGAGTAEHVASSDAELSEGST